MKLYWWHHVGIYIVIVLHCYIVGPTYMQWIHPHAYLCADHHYLYNDLYCPFKMCFVYLNQHNLTSPPIVRNVVDELVLTHYNSSCYGCHRRPIELFLGGNWQVWIRAEYHPMPVSNMHNNMTGYSLALSSLYLLILYMIMACLEFLLQPISPFFVIVIFFGTTSALRACTAIF